MSLPEAIVTMSLERFEKERGQIAMENMKRGKAKGFELALWGLMDLAEGKIDRDAFLGMVKSQAPLFVHAHFEFLREVYEWAAARAAAQQVPGETL